MTDRVNEVDFLFRKYTGVGLGLALLALVLLAVAGGAAGMLFPKFEATALLQFPEAQKERGGTEETQSSSPSKGHWIPKANVIELAAYKRVAASYDSVAQLRAYLKLLG